MRPSATVQQNHFHARLQQKLYQLQQMQLQLQLCNYNCSRRGRGIAHKLKVKCLFTLCPEGCINANSRRERGVGPCNNWTAFQFPVQHLHFDAVLRMMWIRDARTLLPSLSHSRACLRCRLSAKWNQRAWERDGGWGGLKIKGRRWSQSLQHLATFCFNFALLKSGSRHSNWLLMLPRRWQRRDVATSASKLWQLLFGFSRSNHPKLHGPYPDTKCRNTLQIPYFPLCSTRFN